MSSVFSWLNNNWPFVSDSDFVCFARIGELSCSVISMEVSSSLSIPYQIELVVLSRFPFDKMYVEEQVKVDVDLFPDNPSLKKSFSGHLVSLAFQGSGFSLSANQGSSEGLAEKSDREQNIYSVTLCPYVWNATKKNKTVIFHDSSKANIIEKVLKPYKTQISVGLPDVALVNKEVVTQYCETDFAFAVRLMEECDCFCYYSLSDFMHDFIIKSASEVNSSASICGSKNSLKFVKEIHDNFDFNQVINLKTFDYSIPQVADRVGESLIPAKTDFLNKVEEKAEKNSVYSGFSCECSSYNIFAGDYFSVVNEQDQSSFLIQPFSREQSFFVEKSKLVLAYKDSIGWYTRNYLEGFVCDGTAPVYRLKRTTSSPVVASLQKAYVCGYMKNSLFVNSEGKVKVRFSWIPFKEGVASDKASAIAEAQKSKAEYLLNREAAINMENKIDEGLSEASKAGVEKVTEKSTEALDKSQEAMKQGAATAGESFVSDLSSGESDSSDPVSKAGTLVASGVGLATAEGAKFVAGQVSDLAIEGIDRYLEKTKEDRLRQLEYDQKYIDAEDFLKDHSAIWSVENEDKRALSGWIPLAQWGGSGDTFGNYSFPRVGQEVVVGFTDGNPDTPYVSSTTFSLDNKFPYAKVTPSISEKGDSEYGLPSSTSTSGFKDIGSDLKNTVTSPSNMLDKLEGIEVPDLGLAEANDIESSSGNFVIRSFSYDDQVRTNRAGWNEITFFNQRYKEAMRISSAHYIFLQSRDIVNIEAPKLLREVVGIRYSNIIGNRYQLISGKSSEFFAADRIAYFSGALSRTPIDASDGMAAERLQLEVSGKLVNQLARFSGKQIFATVMNNGVQMFLSFIGDYAVLILGGLIDMTTLGAFNVNCNLSSFVILGKWNVNVAGFADFLIGGRFNVSSTGKITFDTTRSFHVDALHRITLASAHDFLVKAAFGKFAVDAGRDISLTSGKQISLKSSKIDITTGNFNINASKISLTAASGIDIKGSKCDIKALKFGVTSAQISLTGAMVKLG